MVGNAVRRLLVLAVPYLGATLTPVLMTGQVVATTTRAEHPLETRRVTLRIDNAILSDVLRQIATQAGLTPFFGVSVTDHKGSVTVHIQDTPVAAAFEQALRGTGLKAVLTPTSVAFVESGISPSLADGSIAGRVTDAKTKRPLRDVSITLDNSTTGTRSGEDGTFRLARVVSGSHVLSFRLLSYTKVSKTVTVATGETTSLDVVLEPNVNALEQVVVTGVVIPTELKAIPSAITVITAKEIERRGITRIDQLFRGDIPGLFAQNQGANTFIDDVVMFSRGATALSTFSAGVSPNIGTTNPIKTYVDGVEMADPKYLSQIDPKSIERIEILTGPQASTIYGSNAINGVMQIFTKRGTTNTPQLTLNLLSGWVENNFSSSRTPQHDYGAQLSGVEGKLSYNGGGSWNYMGPWTPGKQTTRASAFGGTRLELPTALGRVITDVTLRRTKTQQLTHGSTKQTRTGYQVSGWDTNFGALGLGSPTNRYAVAEETLGLTLGYTPLSWWSHEFGMGEDASSTEIRTTARGYTSRSDTSLRWRQTHADRRSLRYTTTARIPMTTLMQATVTLGADEWQNLTSLMDVVPQTLTGSLDNIIEVIRQPGHNTGGFLQTQLGVRDAVFFTYGLRAEWNPDYGEAAQPNYAPRYGAAYTQEIGPVTAKLRASYGRSTRPPGSNLQKSIPIGAGEAVYWGSETLQQRANPDLGPEFQRGGEGGIELYLNSRGSLIVTRYNQVVDALIDRPVVDSVNLLPEYQALYGDNYYKISQYLNIGSIRNQGWELQGSMNTGPFTTKGTYSWTKSRVIGITPKYRAYFSPSNYPQYQPGAMFQFLPEHTWAVGVTYAHANATVALNMTGTGPITTLQDAFYLHNLDGSIRLSQNQLRMSPAGYISANSAYALADLATSYRLSPRMDGVLQVQNLTNRYTNDYSAAYATLGRQTKFGARLRY